jgi:hypothetical protein
MGYGKDSAGNRVAKFTVANRSTLPLLRESHCRVEYRNDAHLVPSFHVAEPNSLNPGQSETLVVPAAANRGAWRVAFKVLKIDRRFKALDWAGKQSLLPEGLSARHYNDRIEFTWSDWIAD